ncbi:MAG: Uncharacterised protein [Polaribacter sp. SA4-10]|nr:MAG: Uncharacterised protein [Polaribacter sp. SA4-10]
MSKKKDTYWFINKAKGLHGDKYDYSSSLYINATKNIQINCIKHKTTFYQTSNSHFKSKFPCKDCRTEYLRDLHSDGINGFIKKMKIKHGDVFLFNNTNYINARTKVELCCKKCHSTIISEPFTLLNGKGCSNCFQQESRNSFGVDKLKEINKYVSKIGGKCLSTDYTNNEENLKFKCKKEHVFYESWSDIKYSMRWCKECAPNRYVGETLTRMILEHLLSIKMPSSYIKSMAGLQLDGYCKEKKIAFEYQGYQHFTKGSYFHNDAEKYKNQQARDSQKKLLCKENGITLIEIFEFKTIRKSRIPVFVKQVKEQLNTLNIKHSSELFIPELDKLYKGRESGLYKTAKRVVEANNGTIQDYTGSVSKHVITCNYGHESNKLLSVIKRDGFNCPICKNESKFNRLKQIIEAKGGALLDVKLKKGGWSNNYNWKCDKGHRNYTNGKNIIQSITCKKCQRKVDIDKFKEIASDNTLTTNQKLKALALSSSKFYSLLKKYKVINTHKPQDRSVQDLTKKSKGEIFQLDTSSFEIIKKYKYLEAVRKESNGKFKPEGIRGQMKKNKKAYGFYWIRAKDYENYLKVNLKE